MSRASKITEREFNKLVRANEVTELSNDDLITMLDGKTRIVPYDELKGVKSIEELLHPYGNVIILYLATPNSGHWCTIIDRGNHYEFFDSYGYSVDEVLPLMPASGKIPRLRRLLQKTNKLVLWNPYELQGSGREIATCGYYCFLRITYKDMPLLEFIDLFLDKKKSPDYIASLLTTLIAIENVL